MAMDLGADHKYDNNVNAYLPSARSRDRFTWPDEQRQTSDAAAASTACKWTSSAEIVGIVEEH